MGSLYLPQCRSRWFVVSLLDVADSAFPTTQPRTDAAIPSGVTIHPAGRRVGGRGQLDVEVADPSRDLFRRNALAQHEADETGAEAVEGQAGKLGVLHQPCEQPVHPAFRVALLTIFANEIRCILNRRTLPGRYVLAILAGWTVFGDSHRLE